MKRSFTFFVFALLSLMACKDPKPEQPVAPVNPAAFEEKESSASLLRKKSYDDDMVSELYKELLQKNEALNELEKSIDKLNGQRHDSLELFNDYDNKNTAYYNSVQSHLQSITDSALKFKMKDLVNNSLSAYEGSVSKHNNLIALINRKDTDIRNLHTILKIVKTLPVAEKFQKENIPSTRPMEKMLATYIRLTRQADTLSKSN